jgi:fumarylacetoacetase
VIDHTHNRLASSWVPGADEHPDFPVQNLPLGVFSLNGGAARIGTAIGNLVLDLHAIAEMMPEATQDALRQPTLNALFALSPADRLALRHALFAKLTSLSCRLKLAPHLHAIGDCTLHLPFRIGDYTDFYVGLHHASNVGALFRPDNPLLPNYKHIPIGYHGRASSVRVSDAPCAARAARSNRPKPKRRSMPPAAVWITNWNWACGSRARMRRATSYPSRGAGTGSAACACSTTGPRATCRPGNISRWAPFWPRAS